MTDQYQEIDIPGVGRRRFPAEMSQEEIAEVLRKEFPSKEPSAGRTAGLAVRSVAEGVAALPGLALTPLTMAINRADQTVQAADHAAAVRSGELSPDAPFKPTPLVMNPSEAVSEGLTSLGVPKPETPGERILDETIAFGSSIVPILGVGNRLRKGGETAKKIGEFLSQGPVRQTGLAGMAGFTVGATSEMGANELTQMGVALGATVLIPAGTRRLGQAFESKVGPRVSAIKEAGASPTLGMSLGSPMIRGLESFLSKFPGAQGVLSKFTKRLQEGLGKRVATGVTAERAGKVIEKGITGEGGFMQRTSATFRQMDEKLRGKVGEATGPPTHSQSALDEMAALVPGLENVSLGFRNPLMVKHAKRLKADTVIGKGGVSFEGLRQWRTIVGEAIDDALVAGVRSKQMERLYGAITRDMEAIAVANGAGKQFARQNQYWTARMKRVEDVLDRVLGKHSTPEEVFLRVNPSNPDQVTAITRTLRSLVPEEREIVARAVVDRLGRTGGKEFNSVTFLQNYGKINPKVRSRLFSPEAQKNLDTLEEAAKLVGKENAGPDMTAHGFGSYMIFGNMAAGAFSIMKADPTAASAALIASGAGIVGSHLTARLLTSQRFVNWLANAPKDPQRIPEYVTRLAVIYANTTDEAVRRDMEHFVAGEDAIQMPEPRR